MRARLLCSEGRARPGSRGSCVGVRQRRRAAGRWPCLGSRPCRQLSRAAAGRLGNKLQTAAALCERRVTADRSRPTRRSTRSYLITVAVGSLTMQLIALLVNNLNPRRRYPSFWL